MRVSIPGLLALGATCAVAQTASSSAKVPVVGFKGDVNANTGQRPSRLPINVMYENQGPGWDLYIQALAAWQAVPITEEQSYFQVVGIHGLPFESWNGVGNVNGGGNNGYCPHGEVSFGTWHRPFLALYEQILITHATTIAAEYTGTNKATYQTALAQLRIPYWDWATNPSLSPAVTEEQVSVTSPTGKKTIRNPLYSYEFPNWPFTNSQFGGTIGQYAQTQRCPTTNEHGALPQNNVVNSNLARDGSYLRNAVYLTFTTTSRYATMVTTSQDGNNFEAPHNTIHDDVGCGNPTGHMTNLGWSAFDPIFFLHHANVDRLLAMWQAIYPADAMFTGTFQTTEATWGNADGQSFTEASALKPFWQPGGASMWTSAGVKTTRTFGYTYPELQDWTMSQSALQSYVKTQVNKLYGSAANGVATRSLEDRASQPAVVTQYVAKISVDRADVDLPAKLSIFLNTTLAGSMNLLSMPMKGTAYANIPLSEPLTNTVNNVATEPQESMIDLLKDTLQMTVTKGDGTTLSALNIPSLSVTLEVMRVIPAADESEFPQYLNSTMVPLLLTDLGISS